MEDNKITSFLIVLIVGGLTVGYIISPIDIIPDVLFPIGFIDDLILGIVGLRYVLQNLGDLIG